MLEQLSELSKLLGGKAKWEICLMTKSLQITLYIQIFCHKKEPWSIR